MTKQERLEKFVTEFKKTFEREDGELVSDHMRRGLINLIGKDPELLPREFFTTPSFQIAYLRFHKHAVNKLDASLLALAAIASNSPGEVVIICSFANLQNYKDINDFILAVGLSHIPYDFLPVWNAQKEDGVNVLDDMNAQEEYRQAHLGA